MTCRHITDIFNMIMYADDTTLICDINGNPADEHLLNMELCKITDWLSANKLSLNVNKTKCMIFHSDKKTVLYLYIIYIYIYIVY